MEWEIYNYCNKEIFEVKNGKKIMKEIEMNNSENDEDIIIKKGKNGKWEEYNKNNELIFEGYYLNNKRWYGRGKEYDNENKLIFDGEYINGKKKGKGRE